MKIVLISPTYNERINIKKLIPILENEVFPKVKNHEMRILIVDDSSPDGTAEEVKLFMQQWKNINLLEGEKKGLGIAYVRGMQYAIKNLKADAIIEFDADFQHDPQDIPKLVNAMDKGADHVIGSRYIKDGEIPKEWGTHRKIISRFGGLFAQLMFRSWHIHDMTSGYKLTKTELLKKIDLDHLYSTYYAYKLHILHDILKQKVKITEVPIIFYERKEGSSKITRKDLFDSFRVVFLLWLDDSKRFIKFIFVGGLGFLVQILIQELTILTGLTLSLSMLLSNYNLVQDVDTVSHSLGAGFGAEAAIISNFLINNFWTFDDARKIKEKSSFITRALKFNLASLGSILIQISIVFIAGKTIGESVSFNSTQIPTRIIVLFPTIILLIIPLNYFIYNFVIWKTQYLKKPNSTGSSLNIS
jgi:dolichol-phosphate mannosyltransferase